MHKEYSFTSRLLCVNGQGDRGFDGVTGPKGTQGEKGERVSIFQTQNTIGKFL